MGVTNRWVNQFGNINDKEWKLYNSSIKDIKEVKLSDFQYKIKNKILVTNSFYYILCLAKYYIYKNKFTRYTLSVQSFISLLKNKFISAKYIANIHNQFAKFMTRWSKVYNYFINN